MILLPSSPPSMLMQERMSAKKAKKEQGQAIMAELQMNRELREKALAAEVETARMQNHQQQELFALLRLQCENQAKELEVRRMEAEARIATGNLNVVGPYNV